MFALPLMVARVGTGFLIGSAIASKTFDRAMSPVTNTIGTLGKVVAEGNDHTRRVVETRGLSRKSKDVIHRMNLETEQRAALITYGGETARLDGEYAKLPEEARKAITHWQDKFPEIF
jgi:hypothetical protein